MSSSEIARLETAAESELAGAEKFATAARVLEKVGMFGKVVSGPAGVTAIGAYELAKHPTVRTAFEVTGEVVGAGVGGFVGGIAALPFEGSLIGLPVAIGILATSTATGVAVGKTFSDFAYEKFEHNFGYS